MGNEPTKPHILTGNGVVDTLLTTALPPGGEVFDVSKGPVTIDYYNLQASDTALAATVSSDYREADVNSGSPLLTSYAFTAADFSWTTEQRQMLDGIEQITDGLKFEQHDTYDSTKVDMVFVETGAASGLIGSAYGVAIFPNTLNAINPHSSHAAVNGGSPDLVATTEDGAAGPRASNLGHEAVGHSIGLTHPFNGSGIGFPAGFNLDDNKYTMMSYNWATDVGGIPTAFGQNVSPMAIDVAAIQSQYGIGDNNTGNTTYNLMDGSQITGSNANNLDDAGNRIALDVNGINESQDLIETARANAEQAARDSWTPEDMTEIVEGLREHGGPMPHAQFWQEATRLKEQSFENAGEAAAAAETARQQADGTYMSGEESIGRAYKTIYDGQRELDAAGNESVGNGGTDEISYDGSEQSVIVNLNDAGLGNDLTNAQYLDQQREIKGSDRFQNDFNAELQNEVDATVNDASGNLRSDAFSAGGHFSKTYTTDANGRVIATQDGGYSIAHGVKIENATGGEKDDTLIGNEHDNVLTGNAGDDAMFGGHGNDTLKAGDGNDTLVAGRGNNQLDGGADTDTASYTNYYDPNVGMPIAQGVSFSITGNQATITKPLNGAVAGPAGASVETDSAVNVEHFEGTARNDTFNIENLSGNMYIDGGAGQDTLTVKDSAGAFQLDMTGGTYPAGHPRAGETFTGTVSDGTNTVYLEDKDLTVTIETPPVQKTEISLEDAIHTLMKDQSTLNRQVQETGVSTPAYEAINHSDAAAMFANLHANGVSSLKAELTPDMDAEERVGHLLLAGRGATLEAGIPMPYERDIEDAQAEVIFEQSHQATGAAYEPEPAHEEDYSYSL